METVNHTDGFICNIYDTDYCDILKEDAWKTQKFIPNFMCKGNNISLYAGKAECCFYADRAERVSLFYRRMLL